MLTLSNSETSSFALFKDSLARRLIAIAGPADTPGEADDSSDSLDDFVSYLASEAWSVFPERLKTLDSSTLPSTASTASSTSDRELTLAYVDSDAFSSQVLDLTPLSFVDTLTSLSLSLSPEDDADRARDFLRKVTADYVSTALTPQPTTWSKTRTTECEICEREVPLTYHHLIPREMHDKVRKRGWHLPEMLGSVAWLCR